MGETFEAWVNALDQRPRLMAALCFVLPFLYFSLWVFQGFDLTDEGYHLTNQLMFVEAPGSAEFGMLWLTHLLGGLWLALSHGWGLLGARFGWVLTLSCTALVAHHILRMYFRPLPAAAAVLATAVALSYHGVTVVSQNNVPFLLLLTAGGLILAADRNREEHARHLRFMFLGGVVMGLVVMSRAPLVLCLPLAALPLAADVFRTRRLTLSSSMSLPVCLAGWALTVGLMVGYMAAAGHLADYLAALAGRGVHEGHTVADLGRIYWKESFRMGRAVVGVTLGLLPWALGYLCICRWCGLRRFAPLVVAVTVFAVFAWTIARHGIGAMLWDYFVLIPGLCCAIALFEIVMNGVTKPSDTPPAGGRGTLLLMGLALAGLIVAGTDNGWLNMMHGLWLLLPAAWLLLPASVDRLARGLRRPPPDPKMVLVFTLCLILLVDTMSFGLRVFNPFKENRRRWDLNAPLTHPRLRGIFTTRARADCVNPLFVQLQRRTAPGDLVLAYADVPMVHFVTETCPALSMSWPQRLREPELQERLQELEQSDRRPRVVVRDLVNLGAAKWEQESESQDPLDPLVQRKKELMDAVVERMGYKPVWSNRCFAILER